MSAEVPTLLREALFRESVNAQNAVRRQWLFDPALMVARFARFVPTVDQAAAHYPEGQPYISPEISNWDFGLDD